MNKNLFIVLIGLLMIGLIAQVEVTNYSKEGELKLVPNIMNLGYSSDQRILVILTNGAQQNFLVYYGLRSDTNEIITIADGQLKISPSTFAFAQDDTMLVIGSKEGSIYGFAIENGKVQTPYKYKKNIEVTEEFEIHSISISKEKRIAVGAKDKVVLLQVPTGESNQFEKLDQHMYQKDVAAVAWLNDDETSILVGCIGVEGYFGIYDLKTNTSKDINMQSTSSIGIFKDGRVIQARVTKNIDILKFNEDTQIYQSIETIPSTINATQIIMDSEKKYFGAQINSESRVLAWKIDTLTEKNLKNSQVLTLQTQLLNQTGTNLALSGNGNQILVVADTTQTVIRYDLCKDGSYYDNGNCMDCANDCGSCYNANTCISCPQEFYITTDDKCLTCQAVTTGCKNCADQKTCTLCDQNLHRKPIVEEGLCVCDEVTYELQNECKLCIESLDFCKTCSDAQNCITCYNNGNINQTAVEGRCLCINGYYLQQKVCKDCPTAITGCKNCDDSKTCTQCNAEEKFQSDGKGGCQCMEGNWYNPTTLACQLCQTSVTGCLLCSQTGQCLTCSQEKRVPSQDKKECICQPHTYQNPQNICQDCDPYRQCLQCKKQAPNACEKCDTSKGRAQNPVNGVCQCNKGFIENEDTHDCIACTIPGCEQCDQTQKCESCFTQKHFKQTPENDVCVCEDKYHLNENQTECWSCDQALTGCKDCDNLKQCKQCDYSTNFELNQETKLCQCKSSFFQQNKNCKLCSEQFNYCQTCNKDNCESCQNGFSFNEQEKKCFCPDDRDFDETAGTCEEKAGLSALAIIAIIVGILALAGGAVAIIKCFKKRQSPLEDGQYEALEGKDK